MTVLKSFKNDPNYTVWCAISGILNGLKNMMDEIGGDASNAFDEFAQGMVKDALKTVGWEAKVFIGCVVKILF